jgi:hypothetical protein
MDHFYFPKVCQIVWQFNDSRIAKVMIAEFTLSNSGSLYILNLPQTIFCPRDREQLDNDTGSRIPQQEVSYSGKGTI